MRDDGTEITAADLLRKYRALRELRADVGPPDRARLRALAAEFPGALRELDALDPAELDARVAALAACASLGDAPRWAALAAGYHALLRGALALRPWLRADPPEEALAACAAGARDPWGEALGRAYLDAVRDPPRGRLNVVVFARLGRRFGCDPGALWQELFPTARRDRFAPSSGR